MYVSTVYSYTCSVVCIVEYIQYLMCVVYDISDIYGMKIISVKYQ